MNSKYILVNNVAVEEPDLNKWAEWYKGANRRVADETINGCRVSTVFLSLDHSYNNGPPMLFETMVFGGELDLECERCTTWEQAEEMHRAMCERVRAL